MKKLLISRLAAQRYNPGGLDFNKTTNRLNCQIVVFSRFLNLFPTIQGQESGPLSFPTLLSIVLEKKKLSIFSKSSY